MPARVTGSRLTYSKRAGRSLALLAIAFMLTAGAVCEGADVAPQSEPAVRTDPAPAETEYSIADMTAWLAAVQEAAGPNSGIVMTSIDERNKRVQIGMRPLRGALERIEAAIAKVDVPRRAVVIEMGCSADGLSRFDKGKSPDQALLAAIDYSLEAPSLAAYGKTVSLKLTLRNISNEPVLVPMGGIPSHDFVVSTFEGKNIWRWQCGQVILDILGGETLEPGEELELVGEWEQVDNRGEPVPAGTYLIRGALNMEHPAILVTAPHQLEVLK